MVKPCEICGAVGWVYAIRICCKCKITREHVYCMRLMHDGDPEKWICEECGTSKHKAVSIPVPTPQTNLTGKSSRIKPPPTDTKTKYYPIEEAMMRGSEEGKNSPGPTRRSTSFSRPPIRREPVPPPPPPPRLLPPPPSPPHPRPRPRPPPPPPPRPRPRLPPPSPPRPRSRPPPPPPPPPPPSPPPPPPSEFIAKPNPQIGPPAFTEPLKFKSVLGSSTVQKLSTLKKKNSPRYLQLGNPNAKPHLPSSKLPNSNIDKDNINSRHFSQQLVPGSAVGTSGVKTNPQPKNVDSEGRESAQIAIELDKYLSNHPSATPTWKGNLKVCGDVSLRPVAGLQAYPPCKVHRKVYNLSKQLPKALEFELLPRLNLWTNLFEDNAPGGLDIGLYFLPSKSNEQSYACLVEFLDQRDMLLKTQIDPVDFLIFSSKQLKDNSQRINEKYFLWGVFRSTDNNTIASTSTSKAVILAKNSKTEGVASTSNQLAKADATESSGDHDQTKEFEVEDMDVDMIGGQDIIGSIDMVVKRPKEADAVVDISPLLEVKKEPKSLFDAMQQELHRQLQDSFDKFADKYLKKDAAGCVKVKQEVKAEDMI